MFWHTTESMHLSCLAGSIQQKLVVLDTLLQKNVSINHASVLHPPAFCFDRQRSFTNLFMLLQLKGQDDLKALVESNTKSISDQLTVLDSHSNKLDEISSTLSILPKQIETDLKQQQSDIFRIFRKDIEVALGFLVLLFTSNFDMNSLIPFVFWVLLMVGMCAQIIILPTC